MQTHIKTIEETSDAIMDIISKNSFVDFEYKSISDKLQYYVYKLNYNLKALQKLTLQDKEPFLILVYYLTPLLNKLQQIEVYEQLEGEAPSSPINKRLDAYDEQINNMYTMIKQYF
ncbi:MAG: hypothetical protein U9N59_14420 [Campylobacterota bacterium]|nr:hypothetical protein [Campylobacterota bacterium]